VSEGLVQGPYMVAGVGFEPAALKAPNLPLSHYAPYWTQQATELHVGVSF